MSDQKTTHFGYQEVAWQDKAAKVADVFHSVAGSYDVMNDLMSLGLHRLWKRFALTHTGLKAGDSVLDVAAGTGDLCVHYARMVGDQGHVTMTDINSSMLSQGRARLLNQGIAGNIDFVLADAENLPFADNQFNCLSISFGLRNVTDKPKALREMYRVLKPGGRLLVLEFSKVSNDMLKPVYDWYSFNVLPNLGQWIANDAESYRYLAESIRMHPDQETLQDMITAANFEDCSFTNLTGGIVALHKAFKY